MKISLLGLVVLLLATLVTGCGSGGYAGGGIVSLSASSVVVDAGQTFSVNTKLSGSPNVSWTLSGGSNCSASGCGSVSNETSAGATYTAPSGITSPVQVTLTAAVAGTSSSQTVNITVNPDPTISGMLPAGVVGTPYSAMVTASGGTAPLTLSMGSGSLPAGLSFNAATGAITGTPTAVGTSTFQVQLVDSSSIPYKTSAQETIVISTSGTGQNGSLVVNGGVQPVGTVGKPYTTTFTAQGGVTPYTFSIASGSLPAGLVLAPSTGVVTGTPTTQGPSSFVIQVQDATSATATAPASITINAASVLTLSPLPPATVGAPYTGTIGVTGGTPPYACSITAGTLPAGLSLNGCVVSGTPTADGTSTVTVQATDSSNPTLTTSGPETITVSPAALSLTLATLPGGTVGVPYSATIGVTGGTSPYSCAITSGTLPAGLSLSGCVVSGTPTAAVTANLMVKATDSSSPVLATNGPESITIAPAALSLTLSTLPSAMVGVPYTATIGVTGGTSPYSCALTAGTLPAGLSLNGCVVSGTPTVAGTSNLMVKATDSSSPVLTATGPESITVSPAGLSLTLATLPDATVGVPYSATIGVTGGTSPYACAIIAGTLPAGLSLTGCVVSGTPTVAGTSNLMVKATDSSSPTLTTTGPESITVSPAPLMLTLSTLPGATVGVPYTATIGVSGGTAPYACAITAGTLPAGLAINGCVVSGTPTTPGTSNLMVKATDSSNPTLTTTGPESITVSPSQIMLSLSTLPGGVVNTPYSATIGVTGGTAPYACAITAGTLPTGLSLNGCLVTGTPTVAVTANLMVKATDASNPSANTTGPESITISPAGLILTLSTLPNATVGVPYTATIGVTGGTSPYACVLTAGTLPAGLALNGCVVSGTPTTAGTANLTVKATDSSSPVLTTTGPESLTVLPVAPLSLKANLPNPILNQQYTQTLLATGGIPPYTYAVTAGAPPTGITLSSGGVLSGVPTVPGASSFTVTVTDTEPVPQTATLPVVLLVVYPTTTNDGELTGPYAFLFQGYDDALAGVLAYQTATAGSFTASGTGVISAGELDANHETSNPTGNTVASNAFLGTYQVGADSRGFITITLLKSDGTTGASATYAISLKAPVSPATVAAEGSLIEYDNNHLQGTRGSGTLLAQTTSAFTAGLSGSYAFGVSGDTPCLLTCAVNLTGGPVAEVGQFTASGGAITGGTSDANIATTYLSSLSLSGSYGTADSNGRVQLTLPQNSVGTPAGVYPSDYAVYVVDASHAFLVSTDKHSSYILLAGSATAQTQTTFANTSMAGAFIGYENTQTNPGLLGVTLQNTLNLSTATIFRGTGIGNGSCDITNVDVGGTTKLVNGLSGLVGSVTGLQDLLGNFQTTGSVACPVSSNGRGTLQYPQQTNNLITLLLKSLGLDPNPPAPRLFYLSSPDQGYFLETGYAGLGRLEAQTPVTYSNATLHGTYVYATTPSASLASIDSSGTFTANGNGSETSTLDENIGVGTINVLQLGVAGTGTYNLDSNNGATTGRYLLNGTTVLYAITPDRFALVDTSALATSPTVSLLY